MLYLQNETRDGEGCDTTKPSNQVRDKKPNVIQQTFRTDANKRLRRTMKKPEKPTRRCSRVKVPHQHQLPQRPIAKRSPKSNLTIPQIENRASRSICASQNTQYPRIPNRHFFPISQKIPAHTLIPLSLPLHPPPELLPTFTKRGFPAPTQSGQFSLGRSTSRSMVQAPKHWWFGSLRAKWQCFQMRSLEWVQA